MPRLFVAVDLPQARRTALAALRDDRLDARWAPADQLHVTLRFVGEAAPDAAEALRASLRDVTVPGFTLSAEGLDVFPSRRRPRVLVASVRAEPRLARLRDEIERVVVAQGFEAEARPFNPHVTFARLKRAPPQEVRRFMKENAGLAIDPFAVTQFHLYRSDLGPDGAEHVVVESYPLGNE